MMPDSNSPAIDTRDEFTIAQERFSRGAPLTRNDEVLLDRVMGNGDGSFDQKDRQIIEDRRNDTAFKQGMLSFGGAVASTLFVSEGAMQIKAPDLNGLFALASSGLATDGAPAAPAQNFTSSLLSRMGLG